MEREYNRNQRSYRPRGNDSREDYQSGNHERGHFGTGRERRESYGAGKERWERKERREGQANRNESPRNYRPFNGRTERPSRFTPGREENRYGRPRREDGEERREYRTGITGRTRAFRQEGTFAREERPYGKRNERPDERREYRERTFRQGYARRQDYISNEEKEKLREKHYSKKKQLEHRLKKQDENEELRLNRFISMGGVCSRRDADELIAAGRVKVNGEVVQVVGQKVRRSDNVEVDGVAIIPEKKIYLVLNKPKDYVTTLEDPLDRKTVMSLVEGACRERIYPVGRLDRQTTGVLLFTNDGDLVKKLTHPKYEQKKIYHVFLDKPLEEKDLEMIASGIDLEDGFVKADEIEYVSPDATEVGIEIHSGKNRIVRRIFEHFGYQIVKLDRVYFAGITKKNIPRGKWRFLTPREVNMLKVY